MTIGGLPALSVTVFGDTAILCETPTGAALTSVDVAVSNANGTASSLSSFTYLPSPPTLTAIAPTSGSSVAPTLITLSGSGFLDFSPGANTVLFNGIPASAITVLSDTSLTCMVPLGTADEVVSIELTNANGSTLLADAFSYHSLPTLTSISPSEGTALGSMLVTLTGSGFVNNAAGINDITFDGVSASTVVVIDDTTLTCMTPAGAPGQLVDVGLVNANGAAQFSPSFRYFEAPTISSLSPTNASATGGELISVSGAGFLDNAAGNADVFLGGIAASNVTVESDTLLTFEAPAGVAGEIVDLALSNQNGSSTLSLAFTYNPLPTLTSLSPPQASSAGGTQLVVTGTGFQSPGAGLNEIRFGGVLAANVVVFDDTSLTCEVPAGTPGSVVSVTLTNDNGATALLTGFTLSLIHI